MDETVAIRPYLAEDYGSVRDILEQGNLFYEPFDSSEALEAKITRDPNSIFVAVDSGRVVGTVSVMEDGRMAFGFRLAVDPEFRNRGIGESLVRRAGAELAERGFSEWHIIVNINSPETIDHFRKLGFEEGTSYRWMAGETFLPPQSRK